MKIINIPFFYEAHVDKKNGGFPHKFPFKFFYDDNLKLYKQASEESLKKLLNEVYQKGSTLNGSMNLLDGGFQGQEALKFINNYFNDFKDKLILEIGCGYGFLLQELSKKGAVCTGLEPGPQIKEAKESNINLINDFFPSSKIEGKFDLIIHFNVLEHIEDPEEVLKLQKEILKPGGKILMGIPNCEPYLESGDLSLLTHEHFNYFTRESLFKIAKNVSLSIEYINTAANNGMIFCILSKVENKEYDLQSELKKINWKDFENKISLSLKNLKNFFETRNHKDIAVYCPLRAQNVLSILEISGCRLVDDNPELTGKYLPSFDNPVESIELLIEKPPGNLIIFSRTFGKNILNKCLKNEKLTNTKKYLIEDFD